MGPQALRSFDDGGRDVFRYVLYRGDAPDRLFRLATIDNMTEYTDADVMVGRDYYYAVSGINEAGEGVLSGVVMATPEEDRNEESNLVLIVIVAAVILVVLIITAAVIMILRSGNGEAVNGQIIVPPQGYPYMNAAPPTQSIQGGTIQSNMQNSSDLPPSGAGDSEQLPPAQS